jgi:hypothetical protein
MSLVRELLSSKKFVVSLVGLVSAVAVKLGYPEASVDEILTVLSPMLVYVGAQGFADFGKSVAKQEEPKK